MSAFLPRSLSGSFAAVALMGAAPLAAQTQKIDAQPHTAVNMPSASVKNIWSDEVSYTRTVAAAHGDKTYIVLDKPAGKIYLFKNDRLALSDYALTGASTKDQIPDATYEKPLSQMAVEDEVTPAGRFTVSPSFDKTLGNTFEINEVYGKEWKIAIHGVWLGNPQEHRDQRLASHNPDQSHISHMCINVYKQTLQKMRTLLAGVKSAAIYILPQDRSLTRGYISMPEAVHTAPAPHIDLASKQIMDNNATLTPVASLGVVPKPTALITKISTEELPVAITRLEGISNVIHAASTNHDMTVTYKAAVLNFRNNLYPAYAARKDAVAIGGYTDWVLDRAQEIDPKITHDALPENTATLGSVVQPVATPVAASVAQAVVASPAPTVAQEAHAPIVVASVQSDKIIVTPQAEINKFLQSLKPSQVIIDFKTPVTPAVSSVQPNDPKWGVWNGKVEPLFVVETAAPNAALDTQSPTVLPPSQNDTSSEATKYASNDPRHVFIDGKWQDRFVVETAAPDAALGTQSPAVIASSQNDVPSISASSVVVKAVPLASARSVVASTNANENIDTASTDIAAARDAKVKADIAARDARNKQEQNEQIQKARVVREAAKKQAVQTANDAKIRPVTNWIVGLAATAAAAVVTFMAISTAGVEKQKTPAAPIEPMDADVPTRYRSPRLRIRLLRLSRRNKSASTILPMSANDAQLGLATGKKTLKLSQRALMFAGMIADAFSALRRQNKLQVTSEQSQPVALETAEPVTKFVDESVAGAAVTAVEEPLITKPAKPSLAEVLPTIAKGTDILDNHVAHATGSESDELVLGEADVFTIPSFLQKGLASNDPAPLPGTMERFVTLSYEKAAAVGKNIVSKDFWTQKAMPAVAKWFKETSLEMGVGVGLGIIVKAAALSVMVSPFGAAILAGAVTAGLGKVICTAIRNHNKAEEDKVAILSKDFAWTAAKSALAGAVGGAIGYGITQGISSLYHGCAAPAQAATLPSSAPVAPMVPAVQHMTTIGGINFTDAQLNAAHLDATSIANLSAHDQMKAVTEAATNLAHNNAHNVVKLGLAEQLFNAAHEVGANNNMAHSFWADRALADGNFVASRIQALSPQMG